MDIKIYYNAKVIEFTDISMVYDNLHTNTYDLHYRLPKEGGERMKAINKEGVARIHIKGIHFRG